MNEDFDETILDNEETFKKRFKWIDRIDIPIAAINKSLLEAKNHGQRDKDLIDIDRIENEES